MRDVESALILTLPLHKDWVTTLVYEEGLAALVSGSLDSFVHVTQLDWPPGAVPSALVHDPNGIHRGENAKYTVIYSVHANCALLQSLSECFAHVRGARHLLVQPLVD